MDPFSDKDTSCLEAEGLFGNNQVYASVFNDFLFKEDLINPDELEPIDTAYKENVIAKAKPEKIYRYRDCLRQTKYGHLLIVGIENQDKIHYAMIVRKMLYDALSYSSELGIYNGDDVDKTEWTVDERLSNTPKGAKITPVITVVFYTGESKWDGPMSLHEMMDIDDKIKPFVPDYPLYVIDLGHDDNLSFANEDLEEIRTLLSSIYNGTADVSKYEVRNSTVALVGILANDKRLYTLANETKGGKRQMCEVLRLRDERIIKEKDEEARKLLAEKDSVISEKDSVISKKDAQLSELTAEIETLKEQLRLAKAQ